MYKNIIIENSGICNLRCTMCQTITFSKEEKGIMSDETFEAILKYVDKDIEWVFLCAWGESFMDKEIFYRIKKIKEKGAKVGTVTHGGLLDTKKIDEIIKSGLEFIHFSFDGATRETYEGIRIGSGYDNVLNNIRALIKMRNDAKSHLQVGANFVIMKKNKHEMLPFAELMFSMGMDCVEYLTLLPMAPDFKLKEEKLEGEEVLDAVNKIRLKFSGKKIYTFNIESNKWKNNCASDAVNSVFINWEGNVSPCCYLSRPLLWLENGQYPKPEKIIGSVLKEPLPVIWNKQDYEHFRSIMMNGGEPEACKYCDLIQKQTKTQESVQCES